MSSTRAFFVGDGSLLVRCAQAWLDAGHSISGIATGSEAVAQWAAAQGLPTQSIATGAPVELPAEPFDYLFSVANLRMLPASVFSRAAAMAINFHDGPLPRYAGLNAPAWALLNEEREHGITWHEVTAEVDAGRIVRQVKFPLDANETALSLNARCYEAGLALFTAIADDIATGELPVVPQPPGRTYVARDQRPGLLGTLDFTRAAEQLAAQVRALDFGPYANPLARAKVWTGGDIVLVRTARVLPTSTAAQPGTVLQADADLLRVATAAGDIELSGCAGVDGKPGLAGLTMGSVLPRVDDATRANLSARTPAVARGERFWSVEYAKLAPVELPYPRSAGAAIASSMVTLPLHTPGRGAATVAAFSAWLSAITAQERVSFAFTDDALAAQATGLESWITPRVAMSQVTRRGDASAGLVQSAASQLANVHRAGPCTRDLPSRLGDVNHASPALLRVGLSLGTASAMPGIELCVAADAAGLLELRGDAGAYSPATLGTIASQLTAWFATFEAAAAAGAGTAGHALLPAQESAALAKSNDTRVDFESSQCVHAAIAAQSARTPGHTALSFHGTDWSYVQLDARANAIAAALVQRGVQPGDVVGLCLPRSPLLVASALAIMKAGAAYLPLDPEYPADRIAYMLEDSATKLVISDAATASKLRIASQLVLDVASITASEAVTLAPASSDSAAYMIYTSGSTGRPKGVVVTHRNVMNFFAGMDPRIPHDAPAKWLAVTSLSFDISVLELFWTLARGMTVVLHSNTAPAATGTAAPIDFSLFYFASDTASSAQDRYRLLMEGAKFADEAGFAAVWTPERHFHAFGGLYPNPAVTSAAIAAMTKRIQIRAGSCVLPLHHPIRVAEEWAFVDNISQGRVGVSFASGWQPNDFVIAPEAFANRKNEMIANIDVVRKLWRGEGVAFPGPLGKPVEVRTLPRPIQPELPVWLTAAGNPETFQQAGALGCHLLTHLLGQKLEDVTQKIALYRAAWHEAGHPGEPKVTLMLHTFVGADEHSVRETVRTPMKEYLRSSVDLIKQAAWSFPTFVQRAAADGKSPVEIMDAAPLSAQEMDALLDHAFNRYYETSALFGTRERCVGLVEKFHAAGVDEIACLVDFGIATDTVLAHLHDLKAVMDASHGLRPAGQRVSVAEQVVKNGVTHLQCTPSMASMLVADAAGRAALSKLQALMVGGEALPLPLARELRTLVPGRLVNMYGPTETTIWSTTCRLDDIGDFVPLGEPIANTRLSVRNAWGMECPALVAGELLIGGEGVTPGYWKRPELDAERFVNDDGTRWYRTGDLVRRRADGAIEFLGRIDNQVKIRGHRIELGEIESALAQQAGVSQAVVIARHEANGDKRLVGYVTEKPGVVLAAEALRQAIAVTLPEVMVPAVVMVLPSFPMTPNGKVDRKALPDPNAAIAVRTQATPQNQLEKTIAGIWQQVLGLPQVGTGDNFFDLGGHSLLVVQVQRRLKEACGREVAITDMFRLPTIRALAAHLGGDEPVTTAVDDGMSRANARRQMRTRAGARA